MGLIKKELLNFLDRMTGGKKGGVSFFSGGVAKYPPVIIKRCAGIWLNLSQRKRVSLDERHSQLMLPTENNKKTGCRLLRHACKELKEN